MDYFALVDDRRLYVRLAPPDGSADATDSAVQVDGAPLALDLAPATTSPVRSVRIGARSLRVRPRRDAEGRWHLEAGGTRTTVLVLDRGQDAVRQARTAAGDGGGPEPLRAPMPGMVMRVEVAVGDTVAVGQGVVIVEAMKMENELKAPAAARVASVEVQAGVAVEKDQVLVTFAPLDEEDA
jgi:biotin carboxyl carrier protein